MLILKNLSKFLYLNPCNENGIIQGSLGPVLESHWHLSALHGSGRGICMMVDFECVSWDIPMESEKTPVICYV